MASVEKPPQKKSSSWGILLFLLLAFVIFYLWGQVSKNETAPVVIGYSQFMAQLQAGNVNAVTIKELQVTGDLKNAASITPPGETAAKKVTDFQTNLPSFQGGGIMNDLQAKGVQINVTPSQSSAFTTILIGFLPWILLIGFWVYMFRRAQQVQGGAGGLFQFGASKAKLYDIKKPHVSYRDVAGMDNVKRDLTETVQFLRDPSKFKAIGAKVPRGILLVGPPGTGKTLLARATAGEAGVPFYSISASEFIEMFVGVGASRVRDMFKKARESQPSIIFIDEIDAVGRTRGAGLGGGHDEREQTLNQLLSEMDGFEAHEEVIVMAATNRPDVLDPALLRPGRFDRQIVVDRPGWKERKAILQIHTRTKPLAPDVDLGKLAKGTPGLTGADLENMANEAALVAARKNKTKVDMSDFEEARDKVLMGAVREDTISDLEKRITAYHESGHALTAWELPDMDPIHKVSILPRGMAMGVTQTIPEEDRHYYPMTYLMHRLAVMLGGRAAEKLVFGDISTGASNDLKEATALAEKMVAQWGMSEKIGPVNLGRGEEHPFLGRELAAPKRYSEEMAWLMDKEIQSLVNGASKTAENILKANRPILDKLAESLIKEEVLDRDAIGKIIEQAKGKQTEAEKTAQKSETQAASPELS